MDKMDPQQRRKICENRKRKFGCRVRLPVGRMCAYRSSIPENLKNHEESHKMAIRNNKKNKSRYFEMTNEEYGTIISSLNSTANESEPQRDIMRPTVTAVTNLVQTSSTTSPITSVQTVSASSAIIDKVITDQSKKQITRLVMISNLPNSVSSASTSETVKIGGKTTMISQPTIIQSQHQSSAIPKIVQSAQPQSITAQQMVNAIKLHAPNMMTFEAAGKHTVTLGDGDKSDANDENIYKKCVFCRQILGAKDVPKLLECLHVTCNACITSKFNEIERGQPCFVVCSQCKTPSKPDGVILDQFLIELSEMEESQAAEVDAKAIKCSSCTDDASATSWCVECAEYICDSCVQAHQRLKITKDHTIKTKEEALADNQTSTNDEKTLMCHVHSQEKLSLFCETCDRLTCRDCQLVDHRDHKYKFANEIATETRQFLDVLLGEITYKRILLNSAMNVIDDRQKLIADKKKELVEEITNMVLRITNTVNIRGKQLVCRLTEVCDGKLKILNEKKEALQLLSNHTNHCIDFAKFALEKGSDSAVLFSKKTLTSHLQQVKSQRADIPNPDIPVRIQVQMNQVQELQKVIQQLGTIIVDGKAYPPVSSPVPNVARQQSSPSNVNPVQPNINSPNMVMEQQPLPPIPQPMPAHRSNMPPPSRSPQIQGTINLRNNMYTGNAQTVQQQPNYQQPAPQQPCNMSRPYPQETTIGNVPNFGRFPNMGPRPTQFRQMTPHVSSSTNPQNMGGANQTDGQMQCGARNDFNQLFNQQMQQQQGLPAQGMQKGHFPGMNNAQTQNASVLLQQSRYHQQQQPQHKRNSNGNDSGRAPDAKRIRTELQRTTEIIDDDDDGHHPLVLTS